MIDRVADEVAQVREHGADLLGVDEHVLAHDLEPDGLLEPGRAAVDDTTQRREQDARRDPIELEQEGLDGGAPCRT